MSDSSAVSPAPPATRPAPPVAPRRPTVLVHHGDERVDDWFWLRDKQDIVLKKTGPARYVLDAKALRHEHRLRLRLPSDTTVRGEIYRVAG